MQNYENNLEWTKYRLWHNYDPFHFRQPVTEAQILVDVAENPNTVFYDTPDLNDLNNALSPEFPVCTDGCPLSQCDAVTVGCAVNTFLVKPFRICIFLRRPCSIYTNFMLEYEKILRLFIVMLK